MPATPRLPRPIPPIPQATIDTIAKRANYSIDINPRQMLLDNIGLDLFSGGGNVWAGDSARDLDDVLRHLASFQWGQPNATLKGPAILVDTGVYECQWTRATVSDVQRLRAAFFRLYGLNKPNYYGPPYNNNSPQPVEPPQFILIDGPRTLALTTESGMVIYVESDFP